MKAPLRAACLFSAAAALAATAWHLHANGAAPSGIEASYIERSLRLFFAWRRGLVPFAGAFAKAMAFKAPLLLVAPFPLFAAFGVARERLALWTGLPLAALSAWAWGRAAREWLRGRPEARDAGALATAVCALLPIAYGLSRMFYAETLHAALLGLWAWRCAAAREDRKREGAVLGVILGLGCLAKLSFPLTAAGFAWAARRRLRPHLPAALALAAAIAASWYAFNARQAAAFLWSASFGYVAHAYEGGRASVFGWLLSLARDGFSWPLLAAAAGTAGFAARRGWRPAAAALWGLAPLAVYAASPNRDPRLCSPLLPAAAALAATAAASLPGRSRAVAAGLLLSAGLGVLADQTFLAAGPRALAYNGAPERGEAWDRSAALEAAARAVGGRGTVAVFFRHPRLNAANLASLAAARRLGVRFLTPAEPGLPPALALARAAGRADAALLLDCSGCGEPASYKPAEAAAAEQLKSAGALAPELAAADVAPGARVSVRAMPPAGTRRALIIGLDGLDWDVVRPLAAAGHLPNLSALMASGSTATVRAEPPLSSAAIWTTVATGVSPARHGISSFSKDHRLSTGADRKTEALWESVSQSSMTAAVVGWLMTWPAPAVNGWLVSDQALNPDVAQGRTFPADLPVPPAWDARQTPERARRFLPHGWDRARQPDLRLPWMYLRDETFARRMESLLARKPRLAMIHLWGGDSASHSFWRAAFGRDASVEERRLYGGAIAAYYEYLDVLVGRLREAAGPDVLIVALSDHGFKRWKHAPGDRLAFLTGEHRPEGVLIVAGPGVKRGAVLRAPRHADVAPTVLRWLGASAPAGLEGRALAEAFLPGALPAAAKPRAARRPPSVAARLPPSAAEGLRALGYIR